MKVIREAPLCDTSVTSAKSQQLHTAPEKENKNINNGQKENKDTYGVDLDESNLSEKQKEKVSIILKLEIYFTLVGDMMRLTLNFTKS